MLREGRAIGAITSRATEVRAVHRQADRAAPDLRRPGGDRDRERAAVQRDASEWRCEQQTATERDPAGHQQLADRRAAGVRRDRARALRACATRAAAICSAATATCIQLRASGHLGAAGSAWRASASLPVAGGPGRAASALRSPSDAVVQVPDVDADPELRALDGRSLASRRLPLACSACRCCAKASRIGVIVRRRTPKPAVHRQADRAAQDLRRPGGDRDRERAAVQRDPGEEPPARGREPAQVRVPRQHVARAADAAQRDHRLLRGAAPSGCSAR